MIVVQNPWVCNFLLQVPDRLLKIPKLKMALGILSKEILRKFPITHRIIDFESYTETITLSNPLPVISSQQSHYFLEFFLLYLPTMVQIKHFQFRDWQKQTMENLRRSNSSPLKPWKGFTAPPAKRVQSLQDNASTAENLHLPLCMAYLGLQQLLQLYLQIHLKMHVLSLQAQ